MLVHDRSAWNAQVGRELRLAARQRLRALHRERGDEVEIFSAHDPWEFSRHVGLGR